jgi:methyl-accepting chemotaxis protein
VSETAADVSSGVGDIAAATEQQAAMVDEVRRATARLTDSATE